MPSAATAATEAPPRWLAAAVDVRVPERGLRLRRLPGQVCLSSRQAVAPAAEPSDELRAEITRCLAGSPTTLLIARLAPGADEANGERCTACAAPLREARADVALGESSGLVVEGLPAAWCAACGIVTLRDAARELHHRLDGFAGTAEGPAVPSLVYETPRRPRSIQLEVSTRCNLTCAYCSHRHLETKRFLDLDDFEARLDRIDFRPIRNVDFTGLGEPVLHPQLPEMVRAVRRRAPEADLRVVTNGTVLTAKRFAPLLAAGLSSVAVSIDSLDAERFARSRGGARLAPVLENLESLIAHRATLGGSVPRVKIKAVLVDEPYAEAERILAYSARLGLSMPHFSRIDPRAPAQDRYEESWLDEGWQGDEAFPRWAEERWRALGGAESAEAPPMGAGDEVLHPAIGPPPQLCRWAVDAAYLTIDGGFLSCCETMIDLPRRHLASLDDAPLSELWTGDLLWAYRLPLALGLLPAGCVGCPLAPLGARPLTELQAGSRGA
ncbi:MAG: radical SAM protein [Acidobacteria bacterium]|nr:radical SAM protein [Acidobacteriota bacterium]